MIAGIKRIRTEVLLIVVIGLLVTTLPAAAKEGLLALIITKPLFATLGVLYAHASRKFLFPYLDLRKLIEERRWDGVTFLTIWYGVIVWAFAVGG